MKKQPTLVPQIGVTYYQRRGTPRIYSPEYLADATNWQVEWKFWMSGDFFVSVDFYPVGKSIMLVKMELTQKGVEYYQTQVSPNYFKSHWALEPEKF